MLIGVSPIAPAKSARWMKQHLYGTIIADAYVERLEAAADPAAEGERLCVELIEELATIQGVAVEARAGARQRRRGGERDRRGAPAPAARGIWTRARDLTAPLK